MKNIKYRKILVWALAISFSATTSCKDYLEIPLPTNSISTTGAFNSKSVIDKMMNNLYAKFTDNLAVPSWQSRAWECFADNSYNPTAIGSIQEYQECHVEALGQSSNMLSWPDTYQTIMLANTLVEGLPGANATGLDVETRDEYIAVAKTIRAYAYFMLVRVFGEVPLVLSTNVDQTQFLGRSAVKEVYAQIESDLLDAISGLPAGTGRPYYISSRFVPQSILANVYLTEGKWEDAETAASSVIESGNYQLEADPDNVFLQRSTETILATGYTSDYSGEGSRTAYNDGWTTRPYDASSEATDPGLSEDLLNNFEPGDQRKVKWVILANEQGYPNPNNRMFQNKYKYAWILDILPPVGLEDDNKLIRLAEIILIRAEARARKSSPDLAGSADDLNIIRNRAGLANTAASSQTDLIDAVLHERRVEFFFENGVRWFDLVRTGKADAVLSVIPYKAANWKPYMVLAPIPKEELDKNKNLLPQNQGW